MLNNVLYCALYLADYEREDPRPKVISDVMVGRCVLHRSWQTTRSQRERRWGRQRTTVHCDIMTLLLILATSKDLHCHAKTSLDLKNKWRSH